MLTAGRRAIRDRICAPRRYLHVRHEAVTSFRDRLDIRGAGRPAARGPYGEQRYSARGYFPQRNCPARPNAIIRLSRPPHRDFLPATPRCREPSVSAARSPHPAAEFAPADRGNKVRRRKTRLFAVDRATFRNLLDFSQDSGKRLALNTCRGIVQKRRTCTKRPRKFSRRILTAVPASGHCHQPRDFRRFSVFRLGRYFPYGRCRFG